MPDLIVTNFNRNFTGVSGTAAGVVRQQAKLYDMRLVGQPLPGSPDPITVGMARRLSRTPPDGKPFTIWHVRRNTEMFAALWARDMLRLPIRIVFTSAAIRLHSAYPRLLISRMDAVIATTEKAATFVPHVKAVVPHGVDTDRFYPAENREAAWAQTGFPGTKGVATIGRIRREKGTDRFVQSMLAYLPDHPDTTALVIGRAAQPDQGFLDSLKSQIAAAGLTDRILFTGEVAPDELPSLLRGLSAVIQLPRYEGYGMAPLEGMASGVPFVATDQGYYRSFSAQDRAGFITEDDTPSTVDRITRLLSDPVRHENMAKAARDVACSHFSIEREASGIAGVYDDLWSKA